MSKYINPFTDFGFKRIFGEEFNKDLLIDFLNTFLSEEEGTITNVTYLTAEQLGTTAYERRAVFDIYCENERGEKFIVVMEKPSWGYPGGGAPWNNKLISGDKVPRPLDWDFQLKAIYTIGILDFIFEEDASDIDKMIYKVKLTDIQTQKIFYDKLTYVYIEMPKFNKTEDELKTKLDQWLYVLKNLPYLERYPARLRNKIFTKLFKVSEIAAFNPTDRLAYEDSLKVYRDLQNVMDTAVEKSFVKGKEEGIALGKEEGIALGKEEGIALGKEEGETNKAKAIAKKMKDKERPIADIMDMTGLSEAQIAEL